MEDPRTAALAHRGGTVYQLADRLVGEWLLPSVYRSDTVILIEQQQVPEEYVVANGSMDLQQRLESMRQQILSRTRLQHIIDQFNCNRDLNRNNPDEVTQQMRKDIKNRVGRSARPPGTTVGLQNQLQRSIGTPGAAGEMRSSLRCSSTRT